MDKDLIGNNTVENNINKSTEIEKVYSHKDVWLVAFLSCLSTLTFSIVLFLLLAHIFLVNSINFDSNVIKYLNILELYSENYVEDIDITKAVDNSIAGLVYSVDDKYGTYIPAENNIVTSQILTGDYYGIGVEFLFKDSYLEVVSIVEDSPAGRSNLKVGDKVTKINGETVNQEMYIEFRDSINRRELKEVLFEVNNELEVYIELGEVRTQKIDYYVENNVGYISIFTFMGDSVELFKSAIDFLVDLGVSEIIFDVRGNGGGDVDVVTEMLDYILGECLLIEIRYSNDEVFQIHSDSSTVLNENVKIKILVDNDSASASELFVMALQDNWNDIEVIGQRTYGKSTVLNYYTFKDGSVLSMSTGYYYPKSGRYIEGEGIVPDILLSDEEIALSVRELVESGILD